MLRGVLALWGSLLAVSTCAQVSGSLTLVSDYRYRGVSLSDQKPAAQLNLTYDHPTGWYGGVFASTVALGGPSHVGLQALPYAGYAQRIHSGLSWDVGASYAAFSGAGGYDYPQLHWGVAWEGISGRLSYAKHYFGQRVQALYAELDGTRPIMERLRLVGHIGVLQLDGGNRATDEPGRLRFDIRAGMGADLDPVSIELAWVVSDARNTMYPVGESQNRKAFVLSLSRAF